RRHLRLRPTPARTSRENSARITRRIRQFFRGLQRHASCAREIEFGASFCCRDQRRRRRGRKLFSLSFRAKVEESRSVTFKLAQRDPSTSLRMTVLLNSSQLREQSRLAVPFFR